MGNDLKQQAMRELARRELARRQQAVIGEQQQIGQQQMAQQQPQHDNPLIEQSIRNLEEHTGRAGAEAQLRTTPQDIAQMEREQPGLMPGERTTMGNIFERPGAAVRSGILSGLSGEGFGKGYKEGAITPEEVPTFQDLSLQKYYEKGDPDALKQAGGLGISAAGLAGDIVTNPADMLLMVAPQAPVVKPALQALGKTKGLRALTRFGTKKRSIPIPGKGIAQKYIKAGKNIKATPAKITGLEDDIAKLKESKFIGTETKKGQLTIERQSQKLKDVLKERAVSIKETGKDRLAEATGRASEDLQTSLRKGFKVASKEYGKRLDKVTSGVNKKAINILQDDASAGIGRGIKKAEDGLLEIPVAVQKIAQKYSRDVVRDASGKIISVPKKVTPDSIISDIKSLRSMLSTQLQRGERTLADDLPIEYVVNELIGVLNTASGGKYSALQKSYAPVMKMKKSLSKIFKPYGGETETKQGAAFLGRIIKPGASTAEKKLYQTAIKGNEYIKPVKDVTKEITPIGKAIQTEFKKVAGKQRRVSEAEKNTIRKLTTVINEEISSKRMTIASLKKVMSNAESYRKWVKKVGIGTAIGIIGLSKARGILGGALAKFGG